MAVIAVPAYSSALVSIMAISIFMHDELNRYRLPSPDEDLVTELVGNRYTMMFYFLFACTLFSAIVLVSLLSESRHITTLEFPLNFMRAISVVMMVGFFRTVVLLQAQYKLAAAS